MLIHRENALKFQQHIYHIVLYKEITLKNNFNTKSDQNIHQDASDCTFFQNFSQGSMPSSMYAAEIIISI